MGNVHVVDRSWHKETWVDRGSFDVLGMFKLKVPRSLLESARKSRRAEAHERYGTPVENPTGLYTVHRSENRIEVSAPSILNLPGDTPVEESNLFLAGITPELKEIFKKKSGADIRIDMPRPYDLNEEDVKGLDAYKKLSDLCATEGVKISTEQIGPIPFPFNEPEFQHCKSCYVNLKVPRG